MAIIFLIIFSASFSFIDFSPKDPVSIAAWNLNVFGDAKANNESLLMQYHLIISQFDIIFLQEIRDIDGSAIINLCQRFSATHECVNSSRAGESNYKEQYLLIYDKKFELMEFIDYNLLNTTGFARPPIKAAFNYNNINFTLYGIHVSPDKAFEEINNLEDLIINQGNVLILGDLNADCSYYSKGNDFKDWDWAITKDTTVSSNDCVYDQILINQEFGKCHIISSVYSENITKSLSDHYLVYAIFDLG